MLKEFCQKFKKEMGNLRGLEAIRPFTEMLQQTDVYPPFETITSGVNQPLTQINGQLFLQFCSNNYLSLSENTQVKQAAMAAVEMYGVGPGGSRVIAGNIDVIEQLEQSIAELTGTEACMTFPTGYMANVSLFEALLEPLFLGRPCHSRDCAIFLDEFNHGSVWDGIKHTSAEIIIYPHNKLDELARLLEKSSKPNKLIVTEGVYSLEGTIADMPAYIDIAKRHGAWLIVDDAHGIGILGENGGGIGEHFGCADQIDLLMGSLDKAAGGTGGYLCGRRWLIDYLRVAMRSSMLSSAIPCMMAGAMIESVKLIKERAKQRAELFEKSLYLRQRLTAAGLTVVGDDNLPSIALLVGEEQLGVEFSKRLFDRGVFCSLVRWPAVPPGQARFRIIVMSSHSREQIDYFADCCAKIASELKMIPTRSGEMPCADELTIIPPADCFVS